MLRTSLLAATGRPMLARGLRTSALVAYPAGGSGGSTASGTIGQGGRRSAADSELPQQQRQDDRRIQQPSTQGFFKRPSVAPTSSMPRPTRHTDVAMPHTPPDVPETQAPNHPDTWSPMQNPRDLAMRGPRFEQMVPELQPQPLSAMEMIQREPIRLAKTRVVACDGGDGPLGHPKVFINLDKNGPKACPYCGLRYERAFDEHH